MGGMDKKKCSESRDENKKAEAEIETEETTVPETSQGQDRAKELEAEVATLKDALLRKLAESDNLRKRLEKEKIDAEKYANIKFAKDLLSVIDNFDRVARSLSVIEEKIKNDAALKSFFDGVSLCGKELLSAFKKHGITKIEVSDGAQFDPNYHQAMCEIENADREPGTIISIMQSGYMYYDRLLRPAMVSVAKKRC